MRLLDYIQGLRKGKEAHRLEKESMKDPFLADALDGFSQVEGNHASKIEQLQKQVSARTLQRAKTPAWVWSAAACLLIGVGVGSYYLLFLQKDTVLQKAETLAETAPIVEPKGMLVPSPEKDTVRVVVPKQNNRHDLIAKVQEPPAAEKNIVEIEATGITQDEVQVVAPTTTRTLADFTKPTARKNRIEGKVVDEKGEPLIGAMVSHKGTDIATLTDTVGNFSLENNMPNRELTAQYIGYESVSLPVDTGQSMLIAMNVDNMALEEVIVAGYGKTLKSSPAGVISKAKSKSKASNDAAPKEPVPLIGKKAFKKYLKENLIRPTDQKCKACKGKVTVTFFVDSNGHPQHIIVTKSLCTSADKEAIRLIQDGPKWTVSPLPVTVEVAF